MKKFIFLLASALFVAFHGYGFCSDATEEEKKASTIMLFKAIDKNQPLDLFIEEGVDLNDTSYKGCPPLAYAIQKGNRKASDKLFPMTNLWLPYNQTTYLHEVIQKKNIEVITKFINYYLKREVQNIEVNDLARKLAKSQISKESKENPLDIINYQDSKGNTPFHLLAYFLSESIEDVPLMSTIIALLKQFKDAHGDMEKQNSDSQSVKTILSKAQERLTNHRKLKLGWTDLHIALKGNDATLEGENFDSMWSAYKSAPLGINVPNLKGTTPFHIVAFKYDKFMKLKDMKKAGQCLDLLKAMEQGGGLLDLENHEEVTVRKLVALHAKNIW